MTNINTILSSLPVSERYIFDKKLIEQIYMDFQQAYVEDKDVLSELKEEIGDKPVLLIAPGASVSEGGNCISEIVSKLDPYIISVNFNYTSPDSDAIFISNQKRIDNIISTGSKKIICTSNLKNELKMKNVFFVNYFDFVNTSESESDNAGVMAIRLMLSLGVKDVYLAGYDGYIPQRKTNYIENIEGGVYVEPQSMESKNHSIAGQIKSFCKDMNIVFVTESAYEEEII